MAENIQLTKKDRLSVAWRHQFLQGSWNYERMQNGGWCYSIIPAIKKLYKDPQDRADALKRHLEFYNTHPYVSAPVMGVTLALEEERANGAEINNQAIQGVKVGMMGPLAGVGDPVFWFTLRPILGALGASLALGGSIVGPLLFFFAWNIIRMAFIWYTQEFGYKVGSNVIGKLISALRLIGADYVFDTTFGADLTVMEEAYELVNRIKNKSNLPMFTSCCPSWVKFTEMFYPEYLDNLSTCKSPIFMEGSIIKNYFREIKKINRDDIISIAIVPCTSKKAERLIFNDIDLVITTRELAKYLKEENVKFSSL